MAIDLSNGTKADIDDIRNLERSIGDKLPTSFLKFVNNQDGAKAATNVFTGSQSDNCSISQFIPVKQIQKEKLIVEGLAPTLIPIAWAEGGNYVVLDQKQNFEVFFWDHEVAEQSEKLAADFAEFLERLEPFDPKTVELKPEQILDAWIDPDFLKSLK